MSDMILSPSIAQGFYPERRKANASVLENYLVNRAGRLSLRIHRRRANLYRFARRVNAEGRALETLDEDRLQELRIQIAQRMRREGLIQEAVASAFALVREFSTRRLGMRHFDVQLMGGWILLKGKIAEMDTGEGKTLTATLPACTAALAGIPVHIITVNDYLAQRDAQWMRPVYEAMGLSVGVVVQGMSLEQRQAAYRCDVTYCTNKEIVFDYLKDRMLIGQQTGDLRLRLEQLYSEQPRIQQLRLRGLCFAIVDEADSVLIDEARVPLILSGSGENLMDPQIYRQVLEIAKQLTPEKDYQLNEVKRNLELTESGLEHLKQLAGDLHGLWRSKLWREEITYQALLAMNLYHRDRDYIVKEGKILIVDENTGRVMQDRSWERGLHQLIEAKEDCEITPQRITIARMSFQKFFRRYCYLSGMTGTARETVKELWTIYRLRVVSIPPNRPSARVRLYPPFFNSADDKWQAVVERIQEVHATGRPILVGTCSVESSEYLSKRLDDAGLIHRVLNARQDQQEAEIIASAGQLGQITVATNMAGRGTDIKLPPEVVALGGLHVIATERHDSHRIDRQLFGRCGRQGDPGSYELYTSLEDDVLQRFLSTWIGSMVYYLLQLRLGFLRPVGNLYASYAQISTENEHGKLRNLLIQQDEYLEQSMAFTGKGE